MSIVLQHIVDTILAGIKVDESWIGSSNEKVRILPSATKGAFGAKIAKNVLASIGVDTFGPGASAYDIMVDGQKTEVKFSTGMGSKGKYTFQQLRKFHDFDRCIFVAVSPEETRIWWATRTDLDEHVFAYDKCRQHGGKKGKTDTYWIKNAEVPLKWFRDMEEWETSPQASLPVTQPEKSCI